MVHPIVYSKIIGNRVVSSLPLILLHGLLGNHRNMNLTARFYEKEGYEVHMLDARNHGSNPHVPEMTYPDMADDLFRYLDFHKIKRCVAIGFSMGGKQLMSAAVSDPHRFAGIVVGDIAPVRYSLANWDIPVIIDALRRINLTGGPSSIYSLSHSPSHSRLEVEEQLKPSIPEKDVRSFIMTNFLTDPPRWRMNLDAIYRHLDDIAGFPYDPSLHSFDKDALFVRGTRSRLLDPKFFADVKAFFPKAEFKDIDAGHWIHNEQPDVFHSVTNDFLYRFRD
eukprot:ANDGO_03328.mRNA.1 Esterase YbfF